MNILKTVKYMYYINCFFIYSIIGFIFENLVGIITNTSFNSGILYGPMTPIYGFGVILILVISKYLFLHLHMPRLIETIISFFILIIVLTLLEFIGGILIEKLFGVVFWDYSKFKFNIGKYIALEISILWGILSIFIVYVIHPILDKFIKKIPYFITIIAILLLIVDLSITIINKI